jgi:hypothetical protein
MIHVIPQHISKGSYTAWYKLLNIKDEHIFHSFDDTDEIERKLIGEPPYIDKLIEKLDKINPQFGDVVIFDCRYINSYNGQLAIETQLIELSKKYNDCKFVLFDDDNFVEYTDTERYTFFSNKFVVRDTIMRLVLKINLLPSIRSFIAGVTSEGFTYNGSFGGTKGTFG